MVRCVVSLQHTLIAFHLAIVKESKNLIHAVPYGYRAGHFHGGNGVRKGATATPGGDLNFEHQSLARQNSNFHFINTNLVTLLTLSFITLAPKSMRPFPPTSQHPIQLHAPYRPVCTFAHSTAGAKFDFISEEKGKTEMASHRGHRHCGASSVSVSAPDRFRAVETQLSSGKQTSGIDRRRTVRRRKKTPSGWIEKVGSRCGPYYFARAIPCRCAADVFA